MNAVAQRRTWFSRHAFERVTERLTMRYGDVAQLLDDGLTLRIGEEEGSDREHLLFFSVPDKICFVAIQDAVTKTVVTVLPTEYYENLCGEISWGLRKRARKCLMKSRKPSAGPGVKLTTLKEKVPRTKAPPPPAAAYRVFAYVATPDGRTKPIRLGSWPASGKANPAAVIADRQFAVVIEERLQAKGALADTDTIVLRRGKDGPPVSFNLETIVDFAAAA